MSDYNYGFRGVNHFGDSLTSDQIEGNIHSWLEWGILCVGGFTNISLATPSVFSTTTPPSKLRATDDPRYGDIGAVWQTVRSDWVWESGINYGTQPVAISGIYISGVYFPTSTTGTHAYTLNYPQGSVVFTNTTLPTGADVRLEHSYRDIQVRRLSEPWFHTFVERSFREDGQFQTPPGSGGDWDILADNRIQLPAIVHGPINRVRQVPYEMGNLSQVQQQEYVFHVFAETPWECTRLHDILVAQKDRRIRGYDKNTVGFPLDANGTPVSGAKTFPNMVAQAPWRNITIKRIESIPNENLGSSLHWTTVRYTVELEGV